MQKNEIKLLLAAKANDYVNLLRILTKIDKAKAKRKSNSYVDIDAQSSDGVTALHYAARHGNIEMMEELISRGAMIDVTDKIGWRPLSYACANHKLSAVEKLIEWGCNINVTNDDNSPVHIAAAMGHEDILKILLMNGANSHCLNKNKETPMDIARKNNNYKIVNLLISTSSKKKSGNANISFDVIERSMLNHSHLQITPMSTAMSANNISVPGSINISPLWSANPPIVRQSKRYNSGSQEQIYAHDRSQMHTFKSHPAKKSESLNAIFVQDDDDSQSHNKSRSFLKMSLPSSATTKSSIKKSESKYKHSFSPTFSQPESLKIKSPLLPLSANFRKDPKVKAAVEELQKHCNNYPNENQNRIFNFNNHQSSSQSDVNLNECLETGGSKILVRPHKKSRSSTLDQYNDHFSLDSRSACVSPEIISRKQFDFNKDKKSLRKRIINQEMSVERHASGYNADTQISMERNSNEFNCQNWIDSIGLSIIWNTLLDEGFESFLALSLATEEDLLILCNDNRNDMELLKTHLIRLNIPTLDHLLFSFEIPKILTQLGLEEYWKYFERKRYFKISHLPNISESLMNQLEIIKTGHRRLLLACLDLQIQRQQTLDKIVLNGAAVSMVNEDVTKDDENGDDGKHMKKLAPPIPPRSCSILNEDTNNTNTVDSTLSEPGSQDEHSSNIREQTMSTRIQEDDFDDIVAMLNNLQLDLDHELNHA